MNVSMNRGRWIRQAHRWISLVFTTAVVAIIAVTLARGGEPPPPWLIYLPLPLLVVLMLSGMYLFVLPYVAKPHRAHDTTR